MDVIKINEPYRKIYLQVWDSLVVLWFEFTLFMVLGVHKVEKITRFILLRKLKKKQDFYRDFLVTKFTFQEGNSFSKLQK